MTQVNFTSDVNYINEQHVFFLCTHPFKLLLATETIGRLLLLSELVV